CSVDKSVRVWDVKTGRELRTLAGSSGPVRGLAFSPDGKRLAGGATITPPFWNPLQPVGKIIICDPLPGETVTSWDAHKLLIMDLAFSSDGTKILSTSIDNDEAKYWDVKEHTELFSLRGHTAPIQRVACSPDGSRLATASTDTTVRLWSAETGK